MNHIFCLFRQEISEGMFPHIAKPRQNYDKKREEHGRPPPAPWAPLFRLQLNRLEVRTGHRHTPASPLPLLVVTSPHEFVRRDCAKQPHSQDFYICLSSRLAHHLNCHVRLLAPTPCFSCEHRWFTHYLGRRGAGPLSDSAGFGRCWRRRNNRRPGRWGRGGGYAFTGANAKYTGNSGYV